VADRLGRLVLEGVAVVAGQAEQGVQGALVGQLAQGEHGALADREVGEEIDARQQDVQPLAAAGLGQRLGREELADGVAVPERTQERAGVGLTPAEPPAQGLDRLAAQALVGVVDQAGQAGSTSRPRAHRAAGISRVSDRTSPSATQRSISRASTSSRRGNRASSRRSGVPPPDRRWAGRSR
jgi:hypothetical protein